MCNCNHSCDCDTVVLPTSTPGNDGADGLFGGWSQAWSFDTAIAASPLATRLRFNNATFASVTQIFINDTNIDSVDVDAFLDAFDNSGNFGKIKVFKKDDSSKFWMGDITGVTDNGADHTIDVTHIASNGSFADTDNVVVSFVASGADAAGSPGADGDNGTTVLVNDMSHLGVGSVSYALVPGSTKAIAAGTLPSNGDKLKVVSHFTTNNLKIRKSIQVRVNGSWPTSKISEVDMLIRDKEIKIEMVINRKSNTEAFIELMAYSKSSKHRVTKIIGFVEETVAGFDFDNNPFDIELFVKSDNASANVLTQQLSIELLKV